MPATTASVTAPPLDLRAAVDLRAAAREALGPERADRADTLPEDALLLWIAATMAYGDLWQRAIARDLDIDSRLVRRWSTGERPVPRWALERLAQWLDQRQLAGETALRLLVARLTGGPEDRP